MNISNLPLFFPLFILFFLPAQDDVGVDDILSLKHFSEMSLLHTLRIRYARNDVYTSVGSILISVNPYKMNRHLAGAVTHLQVDELWRYLVSEAREFHSSTTKESARKAKTADSTSRKEKSDGFVPEGAGSPAGSRDTVKKQEDRKQRTGKGGVKQQQGGKQKQPKGPGKGKGKVPDYVSDDSGSDAGSTKSGKSGRSNASSSRGGSSRQQTCRFFKNGTGCNQGAQCPFRHGQLKPTDGQCFNCGSKSHAKADCPHPKGKPGSRKSSIASDAGGQPAAQEDTEDHRRTQLDGVLTNIVKNVRIAIGSSRQTQHDPMVRICRLAKDDDTVFNQEEADNVPKGAGHSVCVQRGVANVPKGAGHERVAAQCRLVKGDYSDPWVLIDSGASVSIEPMPKSWANGRKIPKEAKQVTVVLGVGTVDGFKVRNTVYTWPNAGVSEPLIPWGRWSVDHDLKADLNPTSHDPHVEHVPSGLMFPIHWINGCPHIKKSQQRELELAATLEVLPEPERLPLWAVECISEHLKKIEHVRADFKKLVTRKVTAYDLEEHRAKGHKKFMPE